MTSEENMGKSPGFRVGPKPAAAGFLPMLATAEIIPFFELIVSSNKRYEALSRSVLRERDGWIGAAPRSDGWGNCSGGRGGRSRPADHKRPAMARGQSTQAYEHAPVPSLSEQVLHVRATFLRRL